jgi:hypothetical protein
VTTRTAFRQAAGRRNALQVAPRFAMLSTNCRCSVDRGVYSSLPNAHEQHG